MSIKLSELTPEQRRVLREHAEKKVNRKLKTLDAQAKKDRKWIEEREQPKIIKQSDEDKVPVRLNPRTVVMVNRNKCVQQADGTWIKK